MKRLNLGCGTDIKAGYVNFDVIPLSGVDVIHDVNSFPYPFEDDMFDEILCLNILEHVDLIPVLKELHRILRKGGELIIQVPHFTSRNNFIDPTHKNRFSIQTFDFFVSEHSRSYYFDFCFECIRSRKITFGSRYKFMEIINYSFLMQKEYEYTFFSSLFQAFDIWVTFVK